MSASASRLARLVRAFEPVHATPAAAPGWLRRSLTVSVWEGVLAEVVGACAGGAVLTAWALHLGFGAAGVGLLSALPTASYVLHLPAALLTGWLGRRRVSLAALALARLCWFGLAAVPLFHPSPDFARVFLAAVVAVSSALQVVGNNAWIAWMSDLVPASLQGRYFGRRTAAITATASGASLVAGLALDGARHLGVEAGLLSGLAAVAGTAGIASWKLMHAQHERRGASRPARHAALLVAPLRDPALRPLLRYQLAWNVGVGLCGSFLAVYMLQDLRLGFSLLALHGTASAASRTAAAPTWGRLLDRLGAARVLVGCSVGLALCTGLWLSASPHRLWPLAIDAIVSGALWGGHGLALFGLPLRLASREKVPAYVGAITSAGALAYGGAAMAGCAAAGALPDVARVAGHPFSKLGVILLFSGIVRMAAGLGAARACREPATWSTAASS